MQFKHGIIFPQGDHFNNPNRSRNNEKPKRHMFIYKNSVKGKWEDFLYMSGLRKSNISINDQIDMINEQGSLIVV